MTAIVCKITWSKVKVIGTTSLIREHFIPEREVGSDIPVVNISILLS